MAYIRRFQIVSGLSQKTRSSRMEAKNLISDLVATFKDPKLPVSLRYLKLVVSMRILYEREAISLELDPKDEALLQSLADEMFGRRFLFEMYATRELYKGSDTLLILPRSTAAMPHLRHLDQV